MTATLTLSWLCGRPVQNRKEIRAFRHVLLESRARPVRVFEWGLGNSTLVYASALARAGREFEWHGVDHASRWFELVSARAARAPHAQAFHLACVPFPHSKGVCFVRTMDKDGVERYIERPRDLGTFDVLIVDGRFRRRCLLVARDVLAADGVVLLHDAHRRHYHPAFEVYPHQRLIPTGPRPPSGQTSFIWAGASTARGAAVIAELMDV